MRFGGGRKRLVIPVALGLLLAAGAAAGLYLASGSRPEAGAAGGPGEDEAKQGGDIEHASKAGQSGGEDSDKKENGEKKTPVPVNVANIETGEVSSYVTSTANLISENDVKVLGEAEGRVSDLNVEEGDHVRKGQVLATLVRDDAEIAVRKAEVKSANARMAWERAERAVAEDLMSRQDYDKLSLDHEIARQELAEAQWRLEKTTIRSPITGRLTERVIQLGQHIRPGDHLFSVADFDPLIARIYLPEKDVYGLKEGRQVRIIAKADASVRFAGRIRQISPVVDTATGTVKVTVEATAPPPDVRPGAFVTIDIVRETRPRAVLLPREAIIRELQEAYVFVANGEVAEKRAVSLGLEEAGQVEALSGVKAGEKVIIAGQGGLKDGSPIKVLAPAEASMIRMPDSVRRPRG